jgi:hypothetical protein
VAYKGRGVCVDEALQAAYMDSCTKHGKCQREKKEASLKKIKTFMVEF